MMKADRSRAVGTCLAVLSLSGIGAVHAQDPSVPGDRGDSTHRIPEKPDAGTIGVPLGDLVDIQGVRDNYLVGQGLIVGLQGTGDASEMTRQALANMVSRQNLNVTPGEVDIANVAMVSVTATLEPFKSPGSRLDITVQSIGGASSLFGGTLIQTPLRGADGNVYAVAQGPVSVGGFSISGDASSLTQNHPTVGRIPLGGVVERRVEFDPQWKNGVVELYLKEQNFQTANRIVDKLHTLFPKAVHALNPGTVALTIPEAMQRDPVRFLSMVEETRVVPHQKARVVINERTGTIVAGHGVTLNEVAVTHGNLSVTVTETPQVSQPAPFSKGKTTVVPRTQVQAEIEDRPVIVMPRAVTISALANALNALGATPRDLVTVLQALHKHGSLNAELVIL